MSINNPGRKRSTSLKLAIVAALVAVIGFSSTVPASAAVVYVGDGRATVYLSKSETRALANGRVPAPPAALPWQLKGAYYGLAYGHRWFAQQYANRGWCSGFTLNIRPWANQGYFGYACNWQ